MVQRFGEGLEVIRRPSQPSPPHEPASQAVSDVIEAAVSRWAAEIAVESGPKRMRVLVDKIKGALRPDYAVEAEAFAATYQMVNYWKVLKSLRVARVNAPRTIVDVGCGSGASASAAVSYALATDSSLSSICVYLVDQSEEQLELAVACLHHVQRAVPGVEIEVRPIQMTVPSPGLSAQVSDGADLVVCAHVLTESDSARAVVAAAYELVSPAGALLTVERREDPVWEDIEAWCRPKLVDQPSGGANTPILEHIVLGTRSWRTRWIVVRAAAASPSIQLLQKYFAAWESRDVDALPDIFAPEAIYREKPHVPALVGLHAIERYWREVVGEQRDMTFRFRRVAQIANGAIVEWESHFVDASASNHLAGMMTIELNSERDRIVELREYFRTKHHQNSSKADQ